MKFYPTNNVVREYGDACFADEKLGSTEIDKAARLHGLWPGGEAGSLCYFFSCSSLWLTPWEPVRCPLTGCDTVDDILSRCHLRRHCRATRSLQIDFVWFWPQTVWSWSGLISTLSHQNGSAKRLLVASKTESTLCRQKFATTKNWSQRGSKVGR